MIVKYVKFWKVWYMQHHQHKYKQQQDKPLHQNIISPNLFLYNLFARSLAVPSIHVNSEWINKNKIHYMKCWRWREMECLWSEIGRVLNQFCWKIMSNKNFHFMIKKKRWRRWRRRIINKRYKKLVTVEEKLLITFFLLKSELEFSWECL